MGKLLILSFIFLLGLKGEAQEIELLRFDFEGRDSLLNCKIIESYDDLIRYLNIYVDPNTSAEDRLHINTSIYRLLSDDPVTNSKVGIEDVSLENKRNVSYKRHDYLKLLNDLNNFNYVYQKDFLNNGAPYNYRPQTNPLNPVSTDFGFSYRSPFYHFAMNYMENTLKSDVVSSDLRQSTKIDFHKFLMLKNLKGRFSKMVSNDKYLAYGREYQDIYRNYNNKCKSFDTRDTIRQHECEEILKDLIKIESRIRSIEIKFQSISETNVDDFKDEQNSLIESMTNSNCPERDPPADADGDGYSYIVDCNDNDPTIYPGAPINCDNGYDDDNCDGIKDLCCKDKDGDGFYSSEDCDCIDDPYHEDLWSKCDCDDTDPTVYPGAPIDCENGSTDDNCDGLKDTIQMQINDEIYLSNLDHIYPPYGLTNFAKDRSFFVYSGLMAVGLGSTIYHKLESNKWYRKYENAETFRVQDDHFKKANRNHKIFVTSAAFTAGVYLTSFVDLKIRYSKYNKLRDEVKNKNQGCALIYRIEFNPIDFNEAGIGPSFVFQF